MGRIHDEIAKAGHVIEYFCSEDVTSGFARGKFARFGFPLAVVNAVRRSTKQGRPIDIVNVHEPAGSALVLLRAVLSKTKIVVTSHGLEERSWSLRFGAEVDRCERPSLKTKILHPATVLWQARLALAKADRVFCLNEEDRDYIVRHYHRDTTDITRIFPAADPIFGRSVKSRDYGQAQRILFAGNWLQRKGIDYLVQAFSHLAAKYPRLELAVLNPGVTEEVVKGRFAAEIRSRVHFIVTREEEQTAEAFEEAHLFVLPSLFEGTPLTLLEAMWSGLPIVTTATCGMKDVIDHGRNGLLVPMRSADAIEKALSRLVDDESLRRSLGESAWRIASESLRWQDSATRVLAEYERVLGE